MVAWKDFGWVIGINAFFLMLCVFLGDLQYGALDDFFMAGVLSGIHGDGYNPHMYFVNALYGYALLPLYYLCPKIGWYYIFEILGTFAAFSTISYILIRKIGRSWGTLLSVIVVALSCSDYYLVAQFTQCSSLFSATGMVVILYGLANQTKGKKCFLFGSFFLFWGAIMRWDAFLMGLPFFTIAFLFNLSNVVKSRRFFFLSFIVLSFLILGAHVFDTRLYETELYLPYKEFQGPRSAFGDATNYNMQAVYEDLEEAGKSGADYGMLTNWIFYDTEHFAVDSLKSILSYVEMYRNKMLKASAPSCLLNAVAESSFRPALWMFFLISLFLFFSNPSKCWYAWGTFGLVLCMMLYLLYLNRLVYRVEVGLWTYASILMIPLLKPQREPPFKIVVLFMTVVLFINVILYLQSGSVVRHPGTGKLQTLVDINDTTDYRQVFSYIDNNPDKMFLAGGGAYKNFARWKNPPYLAEPIGSFKRIVSFGYWTAYLPEITSSLKEFGITNPMKDVVLDNVIVIDEPGLIPFLERHYYDKVSVKEVKRIGDVRFYKYSVEENK